MARWIRLGGRLQGEGILNPFFNFYKMEVYNFKSNLYNISEEVGNMIERQYVLKIQYAPKTTYDNIKLGDKALARHIQKILEENGVHIDFVQAVEFVDANDLTDLDELFNPTEEE